MLRWRRVITALVPMLVFASITQDSYATQNLLTNGDFAHKSIHGVAMEWAFEGEGSPRIGDGSQSITEVGLGGQATVYQVVPLCTLNARYRFECDVLSLDNPEAVVWLGLASSIDASSDQIQWSTLTGPGHGTVEVQATSTNLVVYLSIINHSGSNMANVVFDNATLTLANGSASVLQGIQETAPRTAEYAAGMHYMDRRVPQMAGDMFKRVVERVQNELPESRSDAALALIHLQEVSHAEMYRVDGLPLEQREVMLGTDYLRQVLVNYPEQTGACSMALCKLGEYYNDRLDGELGRHFFERTMRDYSGTKGARWARHGMIDYFRNKGEITQAKPYYDAIKADFDAGIAEPAEMAWADARYLAHTIPDSEKGAFWQNLFLQYKDSAPEPAARFKRNRVYAVAKIGTRQDVVNELSEFITTLGDLHPVTDGYRVELAQIYRKYGDADDRAKGIELCNEVLAAEDAHENHRAQARLELEALQKAQTEVPDPNSLLPLGTLYRSDAPLGRNLINFPNFYRNGKGRQTFARWSLYGDQSNWETCDWNDNPERVGYDVTAAWNTINSPSEQTNYDVCLTQHDVLVNPSTPYNAYVWAAAEGFLGGAVNKTKFQLTVRFYDGFQNLLQTDTTGFVPSVINREWQKLVVEGETPEHAAFADFEIHFLSRGDLHRAIAVYYPSLILGDGQEGM